MLPRPLLVRRSGSQKALMTAFMLVSGYLAASRADCGPVDARAAGHEGDPSSPVGPREELLWPGGVKDGKDLYLEPEKVFTRENKATKSQEHLVSNVMEPTITVFRAPKDKANGAAIIIMAGGGYRSLGIDYAHNVARRFTEMGVTAAFLKHRTMPLDANGNYIKSLQWRALQGIIVDGLRAVKTMRSRSAEYGLDPRKIGIMGSSSGCHLALAVMLNADKLPGDPEDPIEKASSRPDFACLLYPPVDDGELPRLSHGVCPAFIAVALDDTVVDAEKSLALMSALRKIGVPSELHVFQRGGHGFELGTTEGTRLWPQLFEAWLKDNIIAAK